MALWLPGLVAAHPSVDDQLSELEQRRTGEPCNAALELKRGDLHRSNRQWSRAADAYARAAACDPSLDEVDFARGVLELEAGNPAGALSFLNRYLDKHPEAPQALLVRARTRQRLDRPSDAALDYQRAISRLQAPQPDHYLECARAVMAAGRPSDAIEVLDAGLRRLGPVPSLQHLAIDIEVAQRRYDAALQRIDAATSGGTNREEWLIRRGLILEAAGRTEEARQAFASALAALVLRPEQRRNVAALQRLEEQAREGVNRLPPGAAPAPVK